MEDVKDLIGRLMNHVDGSSFSDEELKRQINAIYSIYASIMGSEQIIVQASRYNALKYIHDENPRIRLIGMERLILESRDYTRVPTEEEIPSILDKLEDMINFLIPNYVKEGKYRLVIGIGCTGGKHRSVTLANALYKRMKDHGNYGLTLVHKDVDRLK